MRTTDYHLRPDVTWQDRRVKYARQYPHVARAIISRAGDAQHRDDARAALIGECYPAGNTGN